MTPPNTIEAAKIESIAKDRADWLLDAIALATQDRRFLRGDKEADEVAIEAVLMNGEKAIVTALSALSKSTERDEALEEAAKLIEPDKSAPCDCVEKYETDLGPRYRPICDCKNEGDLFKIISWCEGKNDAARIRALRSTPAQTKEPGEDVIERAARVISNAPGVDAFQAKDIAEHLHAASLLRSNKETSHEQS